MITAPLNIPKMAGSSTNDFVPEGYARSSNAFSENGRHLFAVNIKIDSDANSIVY